MKKEMKLSIILLLIGIILLSPSFVHAETYSLSSKQLQARYYPNSSWNTINWNQWTTTTSDNSMYGIQMNFEPVEDNTGNYNPIGSGTYLLDFYIETNHLSDNLDSCRGITSDFRFEDRTTGNWVSASSSSSSSCLDSYYTTLGGNNAIHYLFQWQISDTQSYPYDASEVQFLIYNFNGSGFTIYNASYFMIMGSLQDYDPQVVSNFKKIANDNANNQALLNGINSSTQNIINNENQVKQDIINNQNQLNQNIINNNNQNTSSIINNQNQNKQDIIDNQNSNTDKEIESQQVCTIIDKSYIGLDNNYLNGYTETNNNSWGVTDYIKINRFDTLTYYQSFSAGASLVFYDENKNTISFIRYQSISDTNIIIPSNAYYVRFSINKPGNKPQFKICKNGNQAMNDSINDMKDMDIGSEDKEVPSDDKYQDYEEQEAILKESMEQADLNDLDIAIDVPTSDFIWQTITRLINSNTLVFGMFIAILSIGIIKLAFGR